LPGLALADCFRADGNDGQIGFTGVAEGRAFSGHFGQFEVSVCMDGRDLATAGIEVAIETGSADTGSRQRDSEMLGPHFFDVENHPRAVWESTDVRASDDGFVADGKLTLRGVTAAQPVRLSLSNGETPVLSGSAEIMRLDWNVGSNDPDFEDTDFIRNRVDLEFELQLQPYSEG